MPTNAAPNRFQNLSIDGFRRLHNVKLTLRPLSVMIGANGAGKTSVLEVLSLLANSALGGLSESISRLSGLQSILTYDRSDSLCLGISMTVPGHNPLDYALSIKPQGIAYSVEVETLRQQRKGFDKPFMHIDSHGLDIKYYGVQDKKLVTPNWDHKPLETSLSQVPKMFQEPEDFRNRLSSSTFYHALNVDSGSPVRLPQPMQPATLPGKNGEELVSCLFYLRETDRDRFETIEDTLRAAFPRFDRL